MKTAMEVRKLKPEENVRLQLLEHICFVEWAPEDRLAWLKDPLAHADNYEYAWGCFDADGTLLSGVSVMPAQMAMNGRAADMAFTGGVVTLPEARNRGCIKKIYEKAFYAMKEQGIVYSFVYPFSFAFYRKFGYEHAYSRSRASIGMEALGIYPFPDGVRAYVTGGPAGDFKTVYGQFICDKNLAIIRDEKGWAKLLDRDPHARRQFTYIHYAANGPDAYLLYEPKTDEDGNTLKIEELVWSDLNGLYAMLGFIYGLNPQYGTVSWEVPECLDVFGLVENSFDVSVKWEHAGMNRVIDAAGALELIEAPVGGGSFVLSVYDKFLPFNSGRYLIEWEAGHLSVKTTDKTPDAETGIETLAQLTAGYLTFPQILNRKNFQIHSKHETLAALFPRKNLFMTEMF